MGLTYAEARKMAQGWYADAHRLSRLDMAGWTLDEAHRIGEARQHLSEAAAYLTTAVAYRGQRPAPDTGTPTEPGACPHGHTGHACSVCHRPICTLCGLYVVHGETYCAEHVTRGGHVIQARGVGT